jgi:hypothetical protein
MRINHYLKSGELILIQSNARIRSKSSLTLTLNEWRFNLSVNAVFE